MQQQQQPYPTPPPMQNAPAYAPPSGAAPAYAPPSAGAPVYQPPMANPAQSAYPQQSGPPPSYGAGPPGGAGAPPPAMGAFNEQSIRAFLTHHKWPVGLQSVLISSLAQTPVRFMIVDDSGSMSTEDGARVIAGPSGVRLVSCSRWSELTEAMRFHADLAKVAQAPTEFRLLNGAAPLNIGASAMEDENNVRKLNEAFGRGPDGYTPLCRHVTEVQRQIAGLSQQLLAGGKKASVIIATDGEASDGDMAKALAPLHALPCQVVIRLCTNDDRIGDYWDNVDKNLELRLDIIDDLVGEAKEISKLNPWFTYGEPLQRIREFGVHIKEFDLVDEKKLSADNMRNLLSLIFGVPSQSIPHPEADWPGFYAAMSALNEREGAVWNPATRVMARWVDMQGLERAYGLANQNTGRGPAPSVGPAMRPQAKADGCCVVA